MKILGPKQTEVHKGKAIYSDCPDEEFESPYPEDDYTIEYWNVSILGEKFQVCKLDISLLDQWRMYLERKASRALSKALRDRTRHTPTFELHFWGKLEFLFRRKVK